MEAPYENDQISRSQQQAGRKVPNLKNLRDMIRKNSTTAQSPNSQINLKSERTNIKNDSECSFTLTSDEEREGEGRRSSQMRNRSQPRDAKILIEDSNQSIERRVNIPSSTVQEVNEREENDEDDDQFLKELELENKMLEEELKSLQQNQKLGQVNVCSNQPISTAGFLPRQQEAKKKQVEQRASSLTNSQNSSTQPVQRRIRFQDEQSTSPIKRQSSSKKRNSLTPQKENYSPYKSLPAAQQNNFKTSLSQRSVSANNHSPVPKPQILNQKTHNNNLSPRNSYNTAVPQHKQTKSLTNRSNYSVSPSKESQLPTQNTNRDSLHNFSTNGQSQGTIDLEKFKSLELRLMGCMRTIKSLEKENQAKTDKISSLQIELDKKTKMIEQLNSEKMNLTSSQTRQNVQSQISLSQKKKEKELETRVKEQDSIITDQKKSMQRYQEMNKQLIEKVKELEQQLLDRDSANTSVIEEANKSKKEIQSLKQENKKLKQDNKKAEYLEREYQLIKQKYDNLKNSSIQFEQATQQLYQNHYILTEKVRMLVSNQNNKENLNFNLVQ